MRRMHLTMLVLAGVTASVLATTATAQDEAVNREVLRSLNQLRYEMTILKEQNSYLKNEIDALKTADEAETAIDVSTVLPLEEFSKQQQLIDRQVSRIDQLESRNISLQKSIDNVINQPPADPSAIFEYGPEPVWQVEPFANQSGWVADVRAIHIFHSEISDDPAFAVLTGPIIARSAGLPPSSTVQGTSHNFAAKPAKLDGPGIRLSLLNQNSDGWFGGAIYKGIFIEGNMQVGVVSDSLTTGDNDNIHASLVNRTLADNNALNDDFDSGQVDFAREDVKLEQQTVEILFGKKIPVSDQAEAFWKVGLRGAYSNVGRNVFYYNLEPFEVSPGVFVPDMDTANVDLSSKMLGLGPVVGAGGTWNIGQCLSLSGDISLAALFADFDVYRTEQNFNQTLNRNAFSNIKVDSSGIVPMLNCSFELATQLTSNCHCAVGYTASAWIGGSRSISIPGWDDVDDETSAYTVEKDDILNHGVYFRVSFNLSP